MEFYQRNAAEASADYRGMVGLSSPPDFGSGWGRRLLLLLSVSVASIGFMLAGKTTNARANVPHPQAVVPPPISQRVRHLGQTGGLVTDFAIQGDLILTPEGDSLTILQLHAELEGATVLSRVSPNQGRIQGIATAGETIFAITPIGLVVIDVHDPYYPQVLSFLPGGGEAVRVAGDFVFVAARAAGLRVINAAEPRRPALVCTFPIPGKVLSLAVDVTTGLAYVAADQGGLRIIDVSAPDLPREVGSVEPEAGVQQLEFQGEYLALSSGDRILLGDISRPGALVLVGEYAPLRSARRVTISGNYGYVADLDGGLKIFDLANMAHPLLIYAETKGAVYDVFVQGGRAYVADGLDGVRILDVSNPSSPEPIARLPLEGVAQGLDLWEDTLLVAAGEAGLFVVDVARERDPAVLGNLDTTGDARDVKAWEGLAYVADGPTGLAIVSLIRKASPQLRGTLYTAGEAQALGVNGTFVYVAADDGGLQIIDAIRPAAPFLVGELALPDGQRAVDIALVNKRAYLAIQGVKARDTGLAIADVGFRDRPVILSRVPGPGTGVAVRGVEPITVGGRELQVVDARASSGPTLLGGYRPPCGAGGMDWVEDTLYLTSGGEGPELTLLDLSDPSSPREELHLGSTAEGGTVMMVDGRVYLAAGRRGLRSLDILGPADLSERIVYDPMDTLTRLTSSLAEPGRVYGAGEAGWSIADVQNPGLPQPLSRVQTDTPVYGLAPAGDRVYVASALGGLLIYNATDQTHPRLLGQWSGSTPLRDVLVRDGYLYLVDQQAGLRVLDPNPPEFPNLLQTLPLAGTLERIVPLADVCSDAENCDLAYVLAGGEAAGLRLVNLGHPTAGVLPMGQFPADVATIRVACPANEETCSYPYAYTLDGDAFSIWELSGSGSGAPLASFRINGTILLLAESWAFVGSDAGHVSVVDLSNPAAPRVMGMAGNGAAVRGMALRENQLLVGLETLPRDGNSADPQTRGQLRIWNVENPRQPRAVGLIETQSPFAVMAYQQELARIVTAGSSLTLFDWDLGSDSAAHEESTRLVAAGHAVSITVAADLPLPAPAASLFVDGNLAYVGTESGLVVVAGVDASAPRIVSEVNLSGGVQSVVVHGGRGYLAVSGGDQATMVFDLSDPAAPRYIGSMPSPTGGPPLELSLADTRGDSPLLWTVWRGWVSWMDIGQPQPGPSEIASLVFDGVTPTDLAIAGDLAYLTDADDGLYVLDISDPAAPEILGSLDTPGKAHAVALASDRPIAYVADGECGVRVVTLENPAAPAEIGFWHTGYALDVTALGTRIYVADVGELIVLEFDSAGAPALPPIPQSPEPADGAMFYRSETVLGWGPPLSHCDPLTFDLYLGTENAPQLIAAGLVSPTFQVTDLAPRQAYSWQVVSHDRQGDQMVGPVWRFQVSTEAQPPPTPWPAPPPELPPPHQDAVPPLVGGLVTAGVVAGAWWWVLERRGR